MGTAGGAFWSITSSAWPLHIADIAAAAQIRAIPAQASPPRLPDFTDGRAFQDFLRNRFELRVRTAEVAVDPNARNSIDELINSATEAAMTTDREGPIDRSRNYAAIPRQTRQLIIIRNFDTIIDLLLVAALREGRRVTNEIVNNVKGFVCPLYPFCTA
jgi:hypothetical protein